MDQEQGPRTNSGDHGPGTLVRPLILGKTRFLPIYWKDTFLTVFPVLLNSQRIKAMFLLNCTVLYCTVLFLVLKDPAAKIVLSY